MRRAADRERVEGDVRIALFAEQVKPGNRAALVAPVAGALVEPSEEGARGVNDLRTRIGQRVEGLRAL